MEDKELEKGSVLDDIFLVADAQLLTDKRGRNYYSLKLNLKGGRQVSAKIWSDNIGENIERGQALEALARVEHYRGEIQLNLQRYNVIAGETFNPEQYVRTTVIDVDEAYETLFGRWERTFTNPLLKAVMGFFHENEAFAAKFKTAPAASNQHHNYRGGLIEHTMDVWNLAEKLSENYCANVDKELLMAGSALHDIGKVHSYNLVSGVSEHTEEGMLVDHIFIGASMISNVWDNKVDPDASGLSEGVARTQKNLLLHMILSHHGKKEWGAPVLPKTAEAVLLHFCDQVSATMRCCFDALDETEGEEKWTRRVNVMDSSRQLFRNISL